MSYQNLKDLLAQHFRPTPLVIAERYKFHRRNQKPDESVADYIVALKAAAATCKFDTFLAQALRDRLVCGLANENIQKHMLAQGDLDWKKAQELALAMESAEQGARSFTNATTTNVRSTTVKKEDGVHAVSQGHKH